MRLVGLLDRDLAGPSAQLREALRLARLEQLDDPRQTLRDVEAGDTTGVEGPHRQLGAGLADRLRGDDPDRVADARPSMPVASATAVAGLADPGLGLALERRADRDRDLLVLAVNASAIAATSGLSIVLVALEQLATALGLELLRRPTTDRGSG